MDSEDDFGDDVTGRIRAQEVGEICAFPFSVKAAIALGVPKLLLDAGRGNKLSAEELAKYIPGKNGGTADAENLDRILRILAAHQLVTEAVVVKANDPESVERKYGATSTLKFLIENDEAGSLAPFVQMHLDPVFAATLQYLHEPILDRSVEPHVIAHGNKSFEYAATDHRFDSLFNKAMAQHTHTYISLLLEQYRGFEGLNTLVDVGGGLGANLAMILSKYPNLRGINFDQPHVVANGIQTPRLEHVGGDFFESVPEGDAVFMKWILHDWADDYCLQILKCIEKALPPHGKIINMDSLLPEASDSSWATKLNLYNHVLMMAYNSGGKERTLTEFKVLAAKAGFKRVEHIVSVDNLSILEFYKN